MGKLFQGVSRRLRAVRQQPKRLIGLAIVSAAIIVPAVAFAWGPDRPTYTMAHPADHVTFDSITDNPNYGDERQFMTVQDLTTGQTLTHQTTLVAGHEYQFQIYIHNDAASNLNASGVGIAKNVTVRAALPASVNGSDTADAFVDASNASPLEIYASASLTSNSAVGLQYENGSAMLHTNTQQVALSDSLITTGVKVGSPDIAANTWDGCLNYAGAVTFKVKAITPQQPNFTITKLVSKHGANQWASNYSAQPGETVDYAIEYKNTGNIVQNNVVLKDTLPAGETYVAGSSILGNSNTPSGQKIGDGITGGGVNIGAYAPGANGWIIFSAQVAPNDQLPTCGPNDLHNIATAETDNGSKQGSADVSVTKTCTTPTPPTYTCSALDATRISDTQYSFKAHSQITGQGATFKKFIFTVRDASNKVLTTQDSADGTFSYEQTTPGTYAVEADLVVTVNGQDKTVTSANCKKTITIPTPPVTNVYECSSLQTIKQDRTTFSYTVVPQASGHVTIKEYVFNFGDGQGVTVGPGQETQTHSYNQAGTYTATVSITYIVNGKLITGVTGKDCSKVLTVQPLPPAECKPGVPMGSSQCTPTPTPTTIPATGPEGIVGGFVGTSALGLGVHSWLASRRGLRDILKR